MSDQENDTNTERNEKTDQKDEENVDKDENEDTIEKGEETTGKGVDSSVTETKGDNDGEAKAENGESEPARVFNLPDKAPKNYKLITNPEEEALEKINKEILEDPDYAEVDDLTDHLETFKKKYLEFEKDANGNIDLFGLSRMMEKIGQAKTHLEMKKMIKEIDTTNTGSICYRDFITMMIGPKTSVLKLILLFEEKMKEKEKPTGVAPKRDLASLP